ncbi:MAG: hypothetical protein FWH53_01100 [Leptospirales bacterium]|nr:hypothetical protein [Leptospirales bacterium]
MNKTIKNFCLIAIISLTGFGAGIACGDVILSRSIKGDFLFMSFIFQPSQNFVDTYSLLNNSNDFKRLAGYYAYKESKLVDLDFLYERYKIEESDIIHNTIIWVAETSDLNNKKLVDFYKKIYTISTDKTKEILSKKIEE